MERYNHTEIEKKWQKRWADQCTFEARTNTSEKKYYPLVEFPYPSGAGLHVGHPRPYIGLDIIARKRRAEGYNVLYPIGWDAFGLPTENYAVKTGQHPRDITKENTDTFRRQIQMLGISFDWSREINTTNPQYYKWTQWIFLQLYKHGLAYKAKTLINWCPRCKIGLANEEVVDNACERCGHAPVEKREKEQWLLAITKYAQRLYDDLDTVEYIERAKVQQRNWIGPSEGALIRFQVAGSSVQKEIEVFTTRPDTLYGATFLVLAPEHPFVTEQINNPKSAIRNKSEVATYVKEAQQKTEFERTATEREKSGVGLEGISAINPATDEEIPVFVADYVMAEVGTGALMGVPAHDGRDWAFAENHDLPIKPAIQPPQYFIFDFDGVVGDTFESHAEGLVENGWVQSIEEGRQWIRDYSDKKSNHARGAAPEAIEQAQKLTEGQARSLAKKEIKLFTEFVEQLAELPQTHFAVVSSGSIAYIKPALEKNGITPSHVLTHEDHHSKEEKIETICRDWGVGLDDVYYFTDTKSDVYELRELLDPRKIIGCAWGFLGKDKLMEVLPEEQILDTPADFVHFTRPQGVYTGEGTLIESGEFSGLQSSEAKQKITEHVGGEWVTTYKLRDWIFSRQRYWGEPIPMVYCKKCAQEKGEGWVPVPEHDLPVELPEVEQYQPTDTGESPLANLTDWVETTCPACGGAARRETDVMPNWAGSSWYYLRYTDPQNDQALAHPDKLTYWTPVDWYNGGMEHTVLHLLYSRFWHKFLYDIGVVPTPEPYRKRTSHGIILAEDGSKMSKSKGNVINPDEIVERFGADSMRVYEMFMGPFDQAIAWSTDGLAGARRFLERVHRLAEKVRTDVSYSKDLERLVHETIKKVSEDVEEMKFNTAVSQLMILSNAFDEHQHIPQGAYEMFLRLLSPFAPHLCEELWERLGHDTMLAVESWPSHDPDKLKRTRIRLVVQIGGKVRANVDAPADLSQEEAKRLALQDEQVHKWLADRPIRRVIYVPGKLINIVPDAHDAP